MAAKGNSMNVLEQLHKALVDAGSLVLKVNDKGTGAGIANIVVSDFHFLILLNGCLTTL
jgi:hypothetical protein